MTDRRPRVLIEDWLPIEELGIERRRRDTTGQDPLPWWLPVWPAWRPVEVIASNLSYVGHALNEGESRDP